ncbi:MAG: hypothetical protein IJJ44_12925, partial [Solobacterium sp.]|nr:hypothetical protein [Solobacterium sp.]
ETETPEEPETPEVTEPEEPEEPEAPEVTEPETPAVEEPEEPEEPEVTEPEEPEETEEPLEEPEEVLEIDENDPFWLKVTPKETNTRVAPTTVEFVTSSIYKVSYTQNVNATSYVVAVKDEITWFLKASANNSTGNHSEEVKFNLPAGEYKLHIAYFQGEDFYLSEDFYNLVVFDAPKVVGTGNFTGAEYGYIDIDINPILEKRYDVDPGLSDLNFYLFVSKTNPDESSLDFGAVKELAQDGIFRIIPGDRTAYGGSGYYKNCDAYGTFDLSYMLLGNDTVKGKWIFTSSDSTHVDIMSGFVPTEMYIENNYGYMYYKGAKTQLIPHFGPFTSDGTEYEGIDRRVKYTSSNPKLVQVDANGTATVVSLPPVEDHAPDTIVTITAKSVAYPDLTATAEIHLAHFKGGKSDAGVISNDVWYSPFNWTIGKQNQDDGFEMVLFNIEIPKGYRPLNGMPVMFSVDKDSGLSFYSYTSSGPGGYQGNTGQAIFQNNENGYGSGIVYVHAEQAGTYTVNVATPIGKSASVKINVDGISNTYEGAATKESQYLINGKPVGGWIKYDDAADKYTFGKDVLKTPLDWSHENIFYADPKTKKLVTGDPMNDRMDTVKKIDGKLYAFRAYSGLIIAPDMHGVARDGLININHETYGSYNAYVSATGELMTGWLNPAGTWIYMDKDTGRQVYDSFVLSPSGKGMLYVDTYGEARGHDVNTGADKYMTDEDGLYELNIKGQQKLFMVRNAAFHTGWLYLHYTDAKGYYWDTNSKNVLEKMYFDPNDHGSLKQAYFTAGGKDYYSYPTNNTPEFTDEYYTVKTISGLYPGEKYPEKYAVDLGHVIDANGALVKNKMVKIAVKQEGRFDRYYVAADEHGGLVIDKWVSVGGKMYYFDTAGHLADNMPTPWTYKDENNYTRPVFSKLKNQDKPASGSEYYNADQKKLTSLLLYAGDKPAALIDAKGNLVINGIATVKTSQEPGAETNTYIADEDGNVVRSDTTSYYKIVTVKGKSYIVDTNGIVQKNSTEPERARDEMYGSTFVMADKNGVLIKKAFRNVTDSRYGTYKVWLDERGSVAETFQSVGPDGSDPYYTATINKKAYLGIEISQSYSYYYGVVIPGKTIDPVTGTTFKTGWVGGENSSIYLNKDGSIKSGFVTNGATKKYIATTTMGIAQTLRDTELHLYGDPAANILYKIKGKIYYFDQFGNMVKGWVHFERVYLFDINDFVKQNASNVIKLQDVYMYFDQKTGAAYTGAKKVLTPAVFDGEISLGSEETFLNNAKRVNTTSTQKKLNFDKNGALIYNQNAKIGKKLKEVGADGVVTTGAPHWADANKEVYILKNGIVATGRKKVDGKYYYFDPATGYKVTNALRKTGKKWYYYGEFGEQETPSIAYWAVAVTLPASMREAWGRTAYVYIGSTNNANLTAIWNKDGSLKQIVYTGTTKPAAGESVSFGLWDSSDDEKCRRYIEAGLNGYVLDKKGLPKTGIVSGFTFRNDREAGSYSQNVAKDGKKTVAPSALSLVKIGKKYYVMNGGVLYNQNEGLCLIEDWSTLPAADQKTLNELSMYTEIMGTGLYIMVNNDGSVAANTKKYGHITFDETSFYGREAEGIWTTNKFGLVLDLCAPYFRSGKKSYRSNVNEIPSGTYTISTFAYKYSKTGQEQLTAMLKFNGNELLGIYDETTGKALNGTYIIGLETGSTTLPFAVWLKNGKPLTGKRSLDMYSYHFEMYVDPNMIGAIPYMF